MRRLTLAILLVLVLGLVGTTLAEYQYAPLKNVLSTHNSCVATSPSSECKGAVTVTDHGISIDYARIGAIVGLLIIGAYLLKKGMYKYRVWLLIASVVILGFILPTCTCDFVLMQTVFGILLGKVALMAGLSLLILFLVISAFTLVFGRYYCGWICPLGAVQELANKLTRIEVLSYKWKRRLRWIRPVMLVLAFLAVAVEVWIPGPTINWYKYKHPLILGLTLALIAISLFTYRPWCNYFCPFGYFLSFLHRIAPYRIRLVGECKKCNLCGEACKNAAMYNGKIDESLCIECGDCVNACPLKSLRYSRNIKIELKTPEKR